MKVLVFGSFDIVHQGHIFFLRDAANKGDLHVVVAKDATIKKLKPKPPYYDERTRARHVAELGIAKQVYLGYEGDKYKVIEQIKPDIICLGYDQWAFTEKLAEEMASRGMYPTVERLEAHEPKRFKSSIFREELERRKGVK